MSESDRLGRYRIGKRIGEGGMGEVFRGESEGAEGFSKPVAIKRVRPNLAADPKIREAFVDEARLARRLEHGNIVQIYDLGLDGEVPYLVTELIDGLTLAEILAAERVAGRRPPVGDSLYLIEHVAAALHYAHRLTDSGGQTTGVIHRDVNPRNVLVSRDGVVKLADFGIAKALHQPSKTLPGAVKGTIGYFAPEQARGEDVDHRADQFSTGVMLYELLDGRNPLDTAETVGEYRRLIDHGLPRLECRVPIDDELADIVARATAVDPSDRYASMEEFRLALESWRVASGLRGSSDGWRHLVRSILGEAQTGHAHALDDGVAAQLQARPVKKTRPGSIAPPEPASRARLAWVMGAFVVLASAVVLWLATRGEEESREPAVAVGAIDAAAAARTTMDAAPLVARADAAPPSLDASPPDAAAARKPPVRKPGRVKINLLPYAQVTVDGAKWGQTPVDRELAPGRHVVVLTNPDSGRSERRVVRVVSGETVVISSW